MAWKRPTSTVTKKFKSQLSAGKIMLTILEGRGEDMEGEILVHFTPQGGTVSSQNYCVTNETGARDRTQEDFHPVARCKIG
jgi:hypothetical protein